jgi:hypothetical protein
MTGLLVSVNVIAPLAVEIFIDDACFKRLIISNPPVTSSYTLDICDGYNQDNTCYSYKLSEQSTTFIPPFTYNNMCSSSAITNYVPILIYSYVINSLLPIFMYFYSVVDRSKIPSKIGIFMSWAILWPAENEPYGPKHTPEVAVFMSMQMMNLCVLITFGLTSPILALVILSSIFTESLMMQISINKFLKHYSESVSRDDSLEMMRSIMEAETKNCWRIPRRCLWLLCSVGSTFYLLYTQDIFLDRKPLIDSIPMIVIIACYPFLIWVLFQILKKRRKGKFLNGKDRQATLSTSSPTIELDAKQNLSSTSASSSICTENPIQLPRVI